MTVSVQVRTTPPTLGQVLFSALGYFLVAVASTWAGYSIAYQRVVPASGNWTGLVLFWMALVPAYVSRAALYEQKSLDSFARDVDNLKWLKKTFSIELPSMLLFLFLADAVYILLHSDLGGDSVSYLIAKIGFAALPMYAMAFRLVKRWPADESLYTFRFRTLFPAFATCLMPFIYGYSNHERFDLYSCAAWAIVLLAFWSLALFVDTVKLAKLGFWVLVVIAVGFIISSLGFDTPMAKWLNIGAFGILMTATMGVSESWRIASRVLNEEDYRPKGKYSNEEKQLYLAGANIATALLLPCFLLTALHPYTNGHYLVFALELLVAQYCLWFLGRTPPLSKGLGWTKAGVVSGLLVPLIVSIGTQPGVPPTKFPGIQLPTPWDSFTAIGLLLVPFIYLTKLLMASILPIRGVGPRVTSKFIVAEHCIALTGVASALIGGCIAIVQIFSEQNMQKRLAALLIIYTVLSLMCAGITWIIRTWKERNSLPLPPSTNNPAVPPANWMSRSSLWGAIVLIRPVPSLIAGLLAAGAVTRGELQWRIRSGVAICALTMLGFVANDLYDIRKDRIAMAVRKALASGSLSVNVAFTIAMALVAFMFAIAPLSVRSIAALSLATVVVIAYSPFSDKFPALKGIYTAMLSCIPCYYGSVISGSHIPLVMYLVLAAFVTAREAFIDAQQWRGDTQAQFRTIAVVVGKERSEMGSAVIMGLSFVAMIALASNTVSLLVSVFGAVTLLIILCWRQCPVTRAGLLQVPMLCGAVSLVLSIQV
jgi:4-hydroxybenzoate polyprenyltransferase